jgi:tetratricopeptide (TPR) repeat protein
MLADHPESAEREFRRGFEISGRMGESASVALFAGHLAEALYSQGHRKEADGTLKIATELGGEAVDEARWALIRACLLADAGDIVDALPLVEASLAAIEGTDGWLGGGSSLMDAAHVLGLAGRRADAQRCLQEALDLFEQKGVDPWADRARRALHELAGEERS